LEGGFHGRKSENPSGEEFPPRGNREILKEVHMTRLFCLAPMLLFLAASLQAQVPKVAADLKPGTLKARGTLSGGPQELSLNLTSTIKEENGSWVITDVTETPFSRSTEIVTVEKGTLVVRKRAIEGEAEGHYDVSGNQATGLIKAAGREIPISVKLDSPLFGEGPAAAHSIAALPLAEGYTTTYHNLDIGSQRVLTVRVRVTGSDNVTVPAGTFDTFKIEYAADGATTQSTLWVDKKERRLVKSQAMLRNGMILTVELLP
jgi:hypothetical protein